MNETPSSKANKMNEQIQAILSVVTTLGFFSILILLMRSDVPTPNERVIDVMIGALGTAWLMILGYHYGSSHDSSIKTTMLNNLTKNGEAPHA